MQQIKQPIWRQSLAAALSISAIAGALHGTAHAQAARGLDAVTADPSPLLQELANRGQMTLLERAFERYRVPQEQRNSITVLTSFGKLEDPKLPMREREALVRVLLQAVADDPVERRRQ